ncbi:MAG: efflux RND transporter periplasmic adaptor subunit [Flammeovirgaceae bacterium]
MKTTYIFFSLLLFVVACSSDKTPESIELAGQAIQVSTQKIANSSSKNTNRLVLNGLVEAQKQASISTRVMGNITQVLVQEGQKVRKGQTLATVHNTDLKAQKARVQAQVLEAEAALKNTNKNYQRFKNLFASKSITQKEFNDVEMQLEMAHARVTAAKEALNEINVQLSYANVVAPFSGRITKKIAQIGSMANPGMPLFQLESEGKQKIVVYLPASEINALKIGDQVAVRISDIDQNFKGKIALINPSSTHSGHQYKVEITPDMSAFTQQLLAGMTAKVTFAIPQKASTATGIWIPKTALVHHGQLIGVYTLSTQQTALLRWIQLGAQSTNEVEVVSGLAAGDVLITQADSRLYNGAKITE